MRAHAWFVLAVLILIVGSTASAEVTRKLDIELSSPADQPFAVENLVGTMKVLPGDGGAPRALAVVHADSQELAELVRFEQVIGEGGRPTLRVRYPLDRVDSIRYPAGSGGGSFLEIFGGHSKTKYDGRQVRISSTSGALLYADVEVRLPAAELEATFRQHVGLLTGQNVRGRLTFDTSSAGITLDKVGGAITADTGSGDVTAVDLRGRFACDTGSGDCELTGFDGDDLSFDTGSGDVIVRSARARRLTMDTGSGDVRALGVDVEEFAGDTGSGDIELQSRGDRLVRVQADTGSGDVLLRLGPEASFEAHADQGSGDLVSRYDDATPIQERREIVGYRRGGGKTLIDVDTGSGDLILEPGL
jgi:hypothetical protein